VVELDRGDVDVRQALPDPDDDPVTGGWVSSSSHRTVRSSTVPTRRPERSRTGFPTRRASEISSPAAR